MYWPNGAPPLVVAYAQAGTVDIDLASEPPGHDPSGAPVYLRDIWPTNEEVSNGEETFHVEGVAASLNGGGRTAAVRAVAQGGGEKNFVVDVRVDTPQEVEYYRNGGILPYVLRQLAAGEASASK